jgi:hypothetical protein
MINPSSSVACAMSTGSRLWTEIESLERAATAARERRCAAILEYHQAQAAEARKKAAQLYQQAQELDKKALPHLEALRQIQGVDYVPRPLKAGYNVPLGAEVRSRSQALKDEAAALNLEANEWERRQVQTSISIQGIYESDFISAVIAKPLIMAPLLDSIVEWVKTQRAKGVAGRITLYCANGRISSQGWQKWYPVAV